MVQQETVRPLRRIPRWQQNHEPLRHGLLCLACAEAERHHPDYRKAVETELAEIRKGNYNFKGIGYPKK